MVLPAVVSQTIFLFVLILTNGKLPSAVVTWPCKLRPYRSWDSSAYKGTKVTAPLQCERADIGREMPIFGESAMLDS